MSELGRSPFDDASGLSWHLYPIADAVYDIGNPSKRIRNIYLEGSVIGGFSVLANNSYLEAENAAGSGTLNLLKADASDNTVLNAATGKVINFDINAVAKAILSATALTAGTNGGTDLGSSSVGWGTIYEALGKTLTLKTGSNAKAGTFTANGATPVTVSTTAFVAGSTVAISLKTVGGSVGAQPHLATATPGTGFTVVATAGDTSVYNWAIIDQA